MPRLPNKIDLDLNLPRPPFWMLAGLVILVALSLVPLALVARARVTRSSQPRIHMIQDMDNQPKLKAQDASRIFADGRAMRPAIAGTIARGELRADDHYYRGYRMVRDEQSGALQAEFFEGIPPQVTVDERLLYRGQERFDIYCIVCHGADGGGNGAVNARALSLTAKPGSNTQWVPAANLHTVDPQTGNLLYGPEQYPDGKLFSVISHGIRNMPGYAAQIEPHDRWAIVAYVRALQLSQRAPRELLTAEEVNGLQ